MIAEGLIKLSTSGCAFTRSAHSHTPTKQCTLHSKVPRPCLRSLRFLRPKIRTLEKMSTRFPLQSPLFLLGLFLRRLVEGRSKCCSRACLFCRINPLAIAAAMAQNVTTAQSSLHTERRLHKQPLLGARSPGHSPMVAAKCSVP